MPLTMPDIRNRYPRLNARAAGWLRHLHRKATTPDDWSEDGRPAAWWDGASTPPTLNFPRFDLSESSYAIGIMADQTPAWREVYAAILEGLAERHLTHWAAIDWLTQLGPDPRRGSYPKEWVDLYIPKHLVGAYDVAGWVANGVAPWGMQPDPIGADGNLFFKGWLNLIQALHAYVTGEDRWGAPFHVAGLDRARFDWTQHRLVELLVRQWTANPMGPHCENTKIWPYCLSAAGLGLMLYDAVFGRSTHHVYGAWLAHTRGKYFGVDPATGRLKWAPLYYDPLIDHVQAVGPSGGLAIAFYMQPQDPVFAEFLYRAAVARLGWNDPSRAVVATDDPRFVALGLTVAKEFGDYATEARLRDHAEARFEPRFFGEDGGEFGFWFNLGEAWPRGQLSALAMVSEVGEPGAWARLFTRPNLRKLREPTVEGVEYPRLGIAQAWNDAASGLLQVATFAGEGAAGRPTTFRVTRLPDPAVVKVFRDGASWEAWRADGAEAIVVETVCAAHSFQIFTGPPGRAADGPAADAPMAGVMTEASAPPNDGARAAPAGSRAPARAPASVRVVAAPTACPCCPSAAGA